MDAVDWSLDPDIAKTARGIARRYRDFVDAEDVKSVLVLWCLENPSTAGKVWAGPAWFRLRRLWTIGQRFARAEKARATGYMVEDEFFYSPALVRSLLPDAFDDNSEKPQNRITETKTGNSAVADSGMEWETMIADLRRALQSLNRNDFELLWTLYSEQECTLAAYCQAKGWNYYKGVKAARRAMNNLLDALGGANPWKADLNQEPQKQPQEGRRATNDREAIHG